MHPVRVLPVPHRGCAGVAVARAGSLTTIWSVTLPFFAVIGCGYLAERFAVLNEASRVGLNNFVFYFSLPVLLFSLMAHSDLGTRFDWSFVGAYLLVSVSLYGLMWWCSPRLFGLNPAEAALHALACVYGNVGYVGIPLVVVAFGSAASVPVIVTLTIDLAVMIPLTILCIETGRGSQQRLLEVAGTSARALFTNPLVLAILGGAAFALLDLRLPQVADNFIKLLGAAAAPCALFALGSSLVGQPLRAAPAETASMCIFKLIVHPAVLWWVMFKVFDVDPLWGAAAVVGASMPVAATVFIMAQQYRSYVARSSTVILISTLLSLATISLVAAQFTQNGVLRAG